METFHYEHLKGKHSWDCDALAYHAGEPASSQQPPLLKKYSALCSQGCGPDLRQHAILAHLSKTMFHISTSAEDSAACPAPLH